MLLTLVVFLLPVISCAEFAFPQSRIDVLSPTGFEVSIADVEGASLFAVHININKKIAFLEAGHISEDVLTKESGRWVYRNRYISLKKGDKLHYWLYVIINRLGYRLDDQEYLVSDSTDDNTPAYGNTPSYGNIPPTTTPTSINNERKNCSKSVSAFDLTPPCSGQVMFYDDFSSDLENNWNHEVKYSDLPESHFTIWTKNTGTSGLSKGHLFIQPKLLESVRNESDRGNFHLEGCTSRVRRDCERTAFSWHILPPTISSRLISRNSFSFLYGDVEIRAKLPSGDWIVPELWLEPVEVSYGAKSGRLFLGKALGNPSLKDSNNNEIGAQLLQQGYTLDPQTVRTFRKKSDVPWSSDFHVYKLRWAPDSIAFFVDGEEIGRVTSSDSHPLNPDLEGMDGSPLAPFDREFYLNIGVHVGGSEDFPDNSMSNGKAKPWENHKVKSLLNFWQHKDDWYPTWKSPNNQLVVDYVKVTAL